MFASGKIFFLSCPHRVAGL